MKVTLNINLYINTKIFKRKNHIPNLNQIPVLKNNISILTLIIYSILLLYVLYPNVVQVMYGNEIIENKCYYL
ncbi:Protein of unknown function [Gryllus bimaculatus]|nr:Protein of unknown function [Gryllus bimaculatus]